uniref:Uncharacterized protein n=3 Tax=Meloidogyne incognita group TaxID=654580 RepID=A0A915N6Y1_MELJA
MTYQPQANNPYGFRADENAHTAESGMPKNEIGFNDQTIRQAFVRKVFTLVTIMLGVVTVMSAIPHFYRDGEKYPLREYLKKSMGLYILSLVVFLVVYFALICCENVRRSHPTNLICTGILTLSIGFVTMVMTSFYTVDSVVLAFAVTTLSCGGIVIFSMTTKRDITSMLGFAVIIGMVLVLFGLFATIWTMIFHTRTLYLIYAGFGTLVFMLYLAIDIQMIMGGRKFEIEPEEHIFAAIMLFMDIVQIFWFILSLFGDRSRSLEEKNKELDGLRRQLAREEEEKHELFAQINSLIGELAQIKQSENVYSKENEWTLLQSELDELKLDFGRKQGELQKICGELAREREESRRRENIMQLESSRMEEELRERDELLKAISNTELKSQLKAAEMALENDKTKNLEILEKIKEEIELKAKLNFDELLEKEKIKNEEKILKAEKENSRFNDLLFSEQRNNELLKGQLNQLEKENTRLTSELIGIEQKAEREIKQLNNSLEKIKKEKEEPSSQPIAKPRKTLNNGNNLNETFVEDFEEEQQKNIIKSELEK